MNFKGNNNCLCLKSFMTSSNLQDVSTHGVSVGLIFCMFQKMQRSLAIVWLCLQQSFKLAYVLCSDSVSNVFLNVHSFFAVIFILDFRINVSYKSQLLFSLTVCTMVSGNHRGFSNAKQLALLRPLIIHENAPFVM